jgi:hypothetical protein
MRASKTQTTYRERRNHWTRKRIGERGTESEEAVKKITVTPRLVIFPSTFIHFILLKSQKKEKGSSHFESSLLTPLMSPVLRRN